MPIRDILTSLPCYPFPSLHPDVRRRRWAEGGKTGFFVLLSAWFYKGYAPAPCYRLLNGRSWVIWTGSGAGLCLVWLGRALRGNIPADRQRVEKLLACRRAAALREQQKRLQKDPRPCAEIKATCEAPIALTPDQIEILKQRLAQPLAAAADAKALTFFHAEKLIPVRQLQGVHLLGEWNTLVFRVDGLPGFVFKIPPKDHLRGCQSRNQRQHEKSEQLRQKFAEVGWTRLVVPATQLLELEIDYGSNKITLPLLVEREAPVDFKAQELVWWDEDFEEGAIEQFTRAVCRYDYSDVKYGNNPACKARDGNLIFFVDIKSFRLQPHQNGDGLAQTPAQPAQLGVVRSVPPSQIDVVKAIATEELGSISATLSDAMDRDAAHQKKKATLKASLEDMVNSEHDTERIWNQYQQAASLDPTLKEDAAAVLSKLVKETARDDLWDRRAILGDKVLSGNGADRHARLGDTLKLLEQSGVILQLYHREAELEWDVWC
jgi:hypothetical protein